MKYYTFMFVLSVVLISSCVEKEKPYPVPHNTINLRIDHDTSIVLFYYQTYNLSVATSDSDIYYSWLVNGAYVSTTPSVSININTNPSSIYVEIVTLHSSRTYSINVQCCETYMFYPSTFTPNGDEYNDVWSPVGIDIEKDSYSLQIFDKNDNLVFKTTDFYYQYPSGQAWDGTVDKIPCPDDYYYYVCKYNDIVGNKHKDSGMLQLIR